MFYIYLFLVLKVENFGEERCNGKQLKLTDLNQRSISIKCFFLHKQHMFFLFLLNQLK